MMSADPSSWIGRYVAGDCQAVWAEVHGTDPGNDFSQMGDQVRAVVRETLRRVRFNVEQIIRCLRAAGYEFVDPTPNGPWPRDPFVPPGQDSPAFANWLQELVGPVPLIIDAWIRTVGDINLVGNHPEWHECDLMTDALVVELELRGYADRGPGWDAREHFRSELEAWKGDVAEYGAKAVGRFLLPFAPDAYHKVNVSGGAPYGIHLPDQAADAICQVNGREIYFTDYLRECFSSGGFPGIPSLPQIPSLCRELLPI